MSCSSLTLVHNLVDNSVLLLEGPIHIQYLEIHGATLIWSKVEICASEQFFINYMRSV